MAGVRFAFGGDGWWLGGRCVAVVAGVRLLFAFRGHGWWLFVRCGAEVAGVRFAFGGQMSQNCFKY